MSSPERCKSIWFGLKEHTRYGEVALGGTTDMAPVPYFATTSPGRPEYPTAAANEEHRGS
jgi:hypothetical protein